MSRNKLLILVAVILLAGVLLQQYLRRSGTPSGASGQATSAPGVKKIDVRASMGGWQEYKNTKLGISVSYPGDFELRGRGESDVAILTYPDRQALVTFAEKQKPRNEGLYASMEDFWKDEAQFIAAQGGSVKRAEWIELGNRRFWEAEEDNRSNNYVGLHRYLRNDDRIFEMTLTSAGEKLDQSRVDAYNAIVNTFAISK